MQNKPPSLTVFTGSNGSSLLEVLLTMVILSIGLLGYAGTQLASMRSTEMGRMRSTVIALANDMADRLKANHLEAQHGNYDGYVAGRPGAPDCSNITCSPGQVRDFDLSAWHQQLSALPFGKGNLTKAEISNDGVNSTLMTISLCWDEQRMGNLHASCPPHSRNALQLFQLRVML